MNRVVASMRLWALAEILLLDGCTDEHGNGGSAQGEIDTSTSEPPDSSSGSTGPTDSSSAGSSTGTVAECGNGVVEIDEHCDGEAIAGVPCPASCRFESRSTLWELRFDVEGGDEPGALVVLADGRAIVGGEAGLSGFISRVSPEGMLDWTTRPSGVERVNDLAAATESSFVAGGTLGEGTMWLARYDPTGELLWEDSLSGPEKLGPYQPGSVTVVEAGRVILVGSTDAATTEPGYLGVYDLAGGLAELQTFAGPPFDDASQLSNIPFLWGTTHPEGLVVAARAWQAPDDVAWLQCRGLNGDVHWERQIEPIVTSGLGVGLPAKPAVGPDGSVALTMAFKTTDDDPNGIWIGRFGPDGTLLWSDVYEGPHGREDRPGGVAVDGTGRIFVHGTVADDDHADPAQRGYDMVLLAYDSDGSQRWVDLYSGEGMGGGSYSWDYGGPVAVDDRGFVLVAGSSMSPKSDYDVFLRLVVP